MKSATTKSMGKAEKLLGIELIRGIAVFAVVLSHSGDGSWGEMSKGVEYLRTFFSFHVPFFLAVSFYFLVKRVLCKKGNPYSTADLKLRFQRVFIPYFVWTVIYLIIRCTFFIVDEDYEKLLKLFDDPSSILFLGGASYHLYFLPLLLSGTIFFYLLTKTVKNLDIVKGLFILLIGLLLSFIISATGNQFQLGPNIAFESLFNTWGIEPTQFLLPRVISVFIIWTVTCLPYIGAAIILGYIDISKLDESAHAVSTKQSVLLNAAPVGRYSLLAISSFIFLFSTFLIGSSSPLRSLQKVAVAFSLLIIAIIISRNFADSESTLAKISINLGKCALGIYLIHPIFIRTFCLGLSFLYPSVLESVSVSSVILISFVSFSISWLVVHSLLKNKLLIHCLV